MEVLDQRERIGVAVKVISFAEPELLARYEQRMDELDGAALYSDADRAAYAAFGFDRASVRRVWLDPRVWVRYVGLVLRGRRPEPAEQDTLQLGGDVLVDADGRVRWIYRSEGPEDRPSVDEIRAALAR